MILLFSNYYALLSVFMFLFCSLDIAYSMWNSWDGFKLTIFLNRFCSGDPRMLGRLWSTLALHLVFHTAIPSLMSAPRVGSLRRQEAGGTAEASRFKLLHHIRVVSTSELNRSLSPESSMLLSQFQDIWELYVFVHRFQNLLNFARYPACTFVLEFLCCQWTRFS